MLFTLAFDHRHSFLTGFLGVAGDPTPEQEALCAEAKLVVYEGLLRALDRGLPAGRPAVLVDDRYGAEVARRARQAGIAVAIPVERSGQRELAMEHEPFWACLERLAPEHAKVLVRYNPAADPRMNRRQRERLLAVQEWTAAHGMGFMLELLVPPERVQLERGSEEYELTERPALTLVAVRELVEAGLRPGLWKLEGMGSARWYAAIAAVVRDARPDAACLVLGRGADEAAVERWLRLAAGVPGFTGFAVGRTLWWAPLRAWLEGRLPREDAASSIAANYLRMVDVYLEAAGGR